MISVITPVYNASRFLDKAIASVLSQKEVSEYILIDDGSQDGSREIINSWKERDDRIIALQHNDLGNHGRSATRNLGIKAAKSDFIAFLDADDFYLPDRFKHDLKIFDNDPEVEGVYNAIGAYKYEDFKGTISDSLELTTVKNRIDTKHLFESMAPFGNMGYFSGDGLTVKREVFKKTGYFNEKLIVSEDTELWCRMALKLNLTGSVLDKPVTMRGLHGNNVFNNTMLYKKQHFLMFDLLFDWALENGIPPHRIQLIWNKRKMFFKQCYSDTNYKFLFVLNTLKKMTKNLSLLKYKFIYPSL